MELTVIKKKLSTYLSEGGYLKNVSDELLYELLISWQEWTGSTSEFYREIGFSHRKMAGLIGKAKKLKREGHFGSSDFKEIAVEPTESKNNKEGCGNLIELQQDGKLIRFPAVDQLIEYMKKVS